MGTLADSLFPDEHGSIFSGSAVIDWDNTAGFGKEAMVAIFTHAGPAGQVQSLAYSLDNGRSWDKYEGNPVMPDPPVADWRDPKVFWHEESSQWVMSLAAKDKIMFYNSPNLKDWEYASEFGLDGGIQANSLDRVSYAVSADKGGAFTYEGDITLHKKNGREGEGGGLTAESSTASFRNVEFENTSNFLTNLSSWNPIYGTWKNSLAGKTGAYEGDAFTISEENTDNFLYEADIKISEHNGGGAGALVFRADDLAENGYFANIDALHDVMKVMKIENGEISVLAEKSVQVDTEHTYHIKVAAFDENIKVYLDGTLVHDLNDGSFSSGKLGLNVWNSSTLFQNVQKGKNIHTDRNTIVNPDFETGDLTGWQSVNGNAFTNDHVTDVTDYWGGSFDQQGNYHLWGFSDQHEGDRATGELHSSYFKLGGSGEINFLLGGGDDLSNRYVSLMRADDDQELIRQANSKFSDDETYKRYRWDASEFIGEILYIKAVDHSTSGWGHMNLDDFQVYNKDPMPTDVDQVAEEPKSDKIRQSGTIKDWSAITGEWVPSTHGSNGGIWECPTLVELPIDGDPTNTKWVLQVSINDGAPAGGAGMQYFDGKTFTNENPSEEILWTDYGADFYAAVDWNGIEDENGEKYWLGWMSNWQYANHTPTTTWRGSGTLPRKMELTQTDEGSRLKQTPISLNSIQDNSNAISYQNKKASELNDILTEFSGDSYELIAEFDISNTKAKEFGFKIRKGEEEHTTIGYEVDDKTLFVDRTHSGTFDYGSNVLEKHKGPLSIENENVKMHIFIDRSSIEVFGNNGETVITDQIFPDPSSQGLEVYSNTGDVTLKSLDIYPLNSIWKEKSGFQSKLTSWELISGNWADTMDGKQGQSSGNSFILSDETGSDFKYEADIKILDSDSHPDDPCKDLVGNIVGAGALVFRSASSGENSYVVNIDAKHNQVKLIKFTNGIGTDLAAYNHGNIKTNKSYRLKVDVSGARIIAYLDNNLVIDTRDQSYKEGHLGLNVWDATVLFNKVKFKPNKKSQE